MLQQSNDMHDNKISESLHTTCMGCISGKLHKEPISKKAAPRMSQPGIKFHTDVAGPFPDSLSSKHYYMSIIDDSSRYAFIYYLTHKSDVYKSLHHFFSTCSRLGNNVTLHSDNGGEYTSKQLKEYLSSIGVTQHFTAPGTPQHNGVAERFNRTIVESTRAFLATSGLPNTLWAEAVNTSLYIYNRTPTSANGGFTPYLLWTGENPHIGHIRTFGCKAYAVSLHHPRKLESRSRQYIYIGPENENSHRLWTPGT